MIPNEFNIYRPERTSKGVLVAEYAVGDLVVKMDEPIQTRIEKAVYVVDSKRPDRGCASGQRIDFRCVESVGPRPPISKNGYCASWFWPLKYLVGPVPNTHYDAWTKPHFVDGLVTRMSTLSLPKSYPEAGRVLRVKEVIETKMGGLKSICLDLTEIPSGVSYNDVGAGAFWPLAELGVSEAAKVRDTRFPHDCPKCRAPAYIGAYGAECSASCGIWTKT